MTKFTVRTMEFTFSPEPKGVERIQWDWEIESNAVFQTMEDAWNYFQEQRRRFESFCKQVEFEFPDPHEPVSFSAVFQDEDQRRFFVEMSPA